MDGRMDRRTDGWMDEQMDGQADWQTDGRTDGWMDGQVVRQMDRWTDSRTDGQADGRTDRWTDRRTDGQADGRTDGRTGGRMDARTDGRTDGQCLQSTGSICLDVSQEGCTLELHRCLGADYHTLAACQLPMRDVIDKSHGRLHGTAQLTGNRGNTHL